MYHTNVLRTHGWKTAKVKCLHEHNACVFTGAGVILCQFETQKLLAQYITVQLQLQGPHVPRSTAPVLPTGTFESARHLYLKTHSEMITMTKHTVQTHKQTIRLFLSNANLAGSESSAGGTTPGMLSHVQSGTRVKWPLPWSTVLLYTWRVLDALHVTLLGLPNLLHPLLVQKSESYGVFCSHEVFKQILN